MQIILLIHCLAVYMILFICRPTQVKWQLMVASCYRRSGKFCNFFVSAFRFITFFCNSLRLFSWENYERVSQEGWRQTGVCSSRSWSSSFKLNKSRLTLGIREKLFIVNMVRHWNNGVIEEGPRKTPKIRNLLLINSVIYIVIWTVFRCS